MEKQNNCRKMCVLFSVHISSDKGNDFEDDEFMNKYHVLQQFLDVFPAEILDLLPHRVVDFSI